MSGAGGASGTSGAIGAGDARGAGEVVINLIEIHRCNHRLHPKSWWCEWCW